MKRKFTFGTVTLSLALLLAACGDGGESSEQVSVAGGQESTTVEESVTSSEPASTEASSSVVEESSSTTATTDSQGIEGREFEVDMYEAIDIFYETFGDDTITISQIDFDRDDGDYEYEIDGWKDGTEYELTVKADGSGVEEQETDDDDDDDEALPLDDVISPQEAMDIALQNSSGGYVEGWDLDVDDGTPKYEVEIEGGDDVEIHATTGEVLEIDD